MWEHELWKLHQLNGGVSEVSDDGDGDGGGARWTLKEQTESHDGRSGNRSLLLAAGPGTVQDWASRGYGWERGAIWGTRSRLAQRLWDQREQCFSISFPVSFNIHLNSSFSKWGTWELWRGDGYPTFGNCLNSLVQKCVQVLLPSYYPSSQASSPFRCLRCLGKKKGT